jgi:glycosyltransferase involved in cell wall biosynthesis
MALKPAPSRDPVILVAGLPDSIHTARWLNMVRAPGIRFVLLPIYNASLNKALGPCRLVATAEDLAQVPSEEMAVFDIQSVTSEEVARVDSKVQFQPWSATFLGSLQLTRPGHAVAAIQRLRPDLVHSMTVQFGGYLCLAGKQYLEDDFPPWLLSNWGSDIYLFRMLPDHYSRLERILPLISAYHAECRRDVDIVREMGFDGYIFPVLPASGGMSFQDFPKVEYFPKPSERRDLIIKGYHGWSGRGLHVLAAVHLAANALRNFRIRITLAEPATQQMGKALAECDGLDVILEPYLSDHGDALRRLSRARTVVGLGISDGISTTLLEAMAVGTFPIQGCGSCGDEWIVPGETGILVSPDDIEALAAAIRRAVTDDGLVDQAAIRNRVTIEARWNTATNGEIALQHYRFLLSAAKAQTPKVLNGSSRR